MPRSLNSASGAPEDEQEQPAEGAETAGEQGPADLAAALSASDAQRPDTAAHATAEVSFVTALRQRTRWAFRAACPLSRGMYVCCQASAAISSCFTERLHATMLVFARYHARVCRGGATTRANAVCLCRRLQALDAYSDQMQRRDEEIDVLECALLIAKHAHPDLVTLAMVLMLRGQQVHSMSVQSTVSYCSMSSLNDRCGTFTGWRCMPPRD